MPTTPPTGNAAGPATVTTLMKSFLQVYPPPQYPLQGALQCPVILPQRRPRDKSRGFVRAYAPMLMDCDIDQDSFLMFLDYFDQSLKVQLSLLLLRTYTLHLNLDALADRLARLHQRSMRSTSHPWESVWLDNLRLA